MPVSKSDVNDVDEIHVNTIRINLLPNDADIFS